MKQLTELLHSRHKTDGFHSGHEELDYFIRHEARDLIKRQEEACFVSLNENSKAVKGYYSLCNVNIPLATVPKPLQNKLPRSFKAVPVAFLSRLAVDLYCSEARLERLLLIEALKRCYAISKTVGSFAVIVAPFDKQMEKVYGDFGFIKLWDSQKLFLPMKTVRQVFKH